MSKQPPSELYQYRCTVCKYNDVRPEKTLVCSCKNPMVGRLVWKKVHGIVILDKLPK